MRHYSRTQPPSKMEQLFRRPTLHHAEYPKHHLQTLEPELTTLRSSHGSDVRPADPTPRVKNHRPAAQILHDASPGEHAMRGEFLSEREKVACDREIRMRLGQALRAAYEPVVSQSLPERI